MFRNPAEGRIVKKSWSFRKASLRSTPLTAQVADLETTSVESARTPARQLRDEFQAAKAAVEFLQASVDKTISFREKANELLEEACRAINRLEQVTSNKDASELSIIACEIKCEARRALTLVKVHGHYNFLVKLVTLVARSSINHKFDQVKLSLHNLILPSPHASPLAPTAPLNGEAYAGTMLRNPQQERAHERVVALEYVQDSQIPGHFCIWWAVGQNLEFYSESTQSTTTFKMDKPQLQVTCIGLDPCGNLWTGHMKGMVRVRKKQNWEAVVEYKYFTDRVRCIAFDSAGTAWVGDEAGTLKIIRYDAAGEQMVLMGTVTLNTALEKYSSGLHLPPMHSATGGTVDDTTALSVQPTPSPRSSISWMSIFRGHGFSSCVNPSSVSIHGPVRAMFARDNRMWVSGGRATLAWLSVFDTATQADVDMYECKSFGAAYVITTLPCGSGTARQDTLASPTSSGVGLDLMGVHLEGTSRSSSSGSCCGWRLLTGHENGQLLVWSSSTQKLQPVLTIGQPQSPCRGIFLFPAHNLMTTVHYNGNMHLFVQPTIDAETLTLASKGEKLPTLKPRRHTIHAHRTAIIRMRGQGDTCVTASVLGTIRVWHGFLLVEEARRHNLITNPAERARSGMSAMASTDALSGTNSLGKAISMGTGSEPSGTLPGVVIDKARRTHSQPHVNSFQLIDGSELILMKVIGSGGYGKVWLAEWGGTQVAVKELNPVAPDHAVPMPREGDQGSDSSGHGSGGIGGNAFDNEVGFMGSLCHPNVVRFLAVVLEPPMIVMQYYPHGSLFDLLKRARRHDRDAAKELSWLKRLDMLRDIAAGLAFLHKRGVVHGDVRSPNMLLDYTSDNGRPRFHIRIADFGLARMLGRQGHVAVSKPTNPRWAAPEVIQKSLLSKAADVFSYGVVMWEMLTWQEPYEDMLSLQVLFSATQNKRPELPANDVELPGQPGQSVKQFKELMEQCWAPDAFCRPSCDAIMHQLDAMRALEAPPEKPRMHQIRRPTADGCSPDNSTPGGPASTLKPPAAHADRTPGPTVPGGEINMITLGTPQPTGLPTTSPPATASPFADSPFSDFVGFSTPQPAAQAEKPAPLQSPFGSAAFGSPDQQASDAFSPFAAASSENHTPQASAAFSPFAAAGSENHTPQASAAFSPFAAASSESQTPTPAAMPSFSPFAAAPTDAHAATASHSPFAASSHETHSKAANTHSPFAAAATYPVHITASSHSPFSASSAHPPPASPIQPQAGAFSPFAATPFSSPFAAQPQLSASIPEAYTSHHHTTPTTNPFALASQATPDDHGNSLGTTTAAPAPAPASLAVASYSGNGLEITSTSPPLMTSASLSLQLFSEGSIPPTPSAIPTDRASPPPQQFIGGGSYSSNHSSFNRPSPNLQLNSGPWTHHDDTHSAASTQPGTPNTASRHRLGGSAYNSHSTSFDHSHFPGTSTHATSQLNSAEHPLANGLHTAQHSPGYDHMLGGSAYASQNTSFDSQALSSNLTRLSFLDESGRSTPAPGPSSPWDRRVSETDSINVPVDPFSNPSISLPLPQGLPPRAPSSSHQQTLPLAAQLPTYMHNASPEAGGGGGSTLASPSAASRQLWKQGSSAARMSNAPVLALSSSQNSTSNSLTNTALSSPALPSPLSGNPFKDASDETAASTDTSALPSRTPSPPPANLTHNPAFDPSSLKLHSSTFVNALFDATGAAPWSPSSPGHVFYEGVYNPAAATAGVLEHALADTTPVDSLMCKGRTQMPGHFATPLDAPMMVLPPSH